MPPGDLSVHMSHVPVTFYYAPDPAKPPADALKEAIAKFLPDIEVTSDFRDDLALPFIVFGQEEASDEGFFIPDDRTLDFFGRGMSEDDKKAIQQTRSTNYIGLVVSREDRWKVIRAFNQMVHSFADETGAILVDGATREYFHPDAWKAKRIDDWGEGLIPDMRSQTSIHLYPRGDGYLRAITLGMEKFALPDVAIERLVASQNSPAGNLINLVCQGIAMNPVVTDPANYQVSLQKLEPGQLEESYRTLLFGNGTGTALISLMPGTPDEGDPDNSQISLGFPHGDGATEEERKVSTLGQLWGYGESLVREVERDDDEINRASAKAKEKLLGHKKSFQEDLPVGSHLLIKAPFATDDDGIEWMWVQAITWKDDGIIIGLLQNEPRQISGLKAGAECKVKETEIFDYILSKPDGTHEGNETGELIEKLQSR